ncbi:hypothetical protein PAE9249_00072 [Paenibacillus sp. CECT 9249]|nr:hypothetical protein PAE9249_00072 [Paenibacillus sp. CECT 9249]
MFYLFWTTMALGIGSGVLVWALLRSIDPTFIFLDDKISKYEISSLFLGVATITLISVIGFIAFLFGRFYIIGILRNRLKAWNFIQIFFIVLTLFDLFYIRLKKFSSGEESLGAYIWLPLVILLVAVAVTYWKVRLTNKHAILPTLFFMIVITTLELLPSLSVNRIEYIVYMLVPLVVCNAWQILTLHKLVGEKA